MFCINKHFLFFVAALSFLAVSCARMEEPLIENLSSSEKGVVVLLDEISLRPFKGTYILVNDFPEDYSIEKSWIRYENGILVFSGTTDFNERRDTLIYEFEDFIYKLPVVQQGLCEVIDRPSVILDSEGFGSLIIRYTSVWSLYYGNFLLADNSENVTNVSICLSSEQLASGVNYLTFSCEEGELFIPLVIDSIVICVPSGSSTYSFEDVTGFLDVELSCNWCSFSNDSFLFEENPLYDYRYTVVTLYLSNSSVTKICFKQLPRVAAMDSCVPGFYSLPDSYIPSVKAIYPVSVKSSVQGKMSLFSFLSIIPEHNLLVQLPLADSYHSGDVFNSIKITSNNINIFCIGSVIKRNGNKFWIMCQTDNEDIGVLIIEMPFVS